MAPASPVLFSRAAVLQLCAALLLSLPGAVPAAPARGDPLPRAAPESVGLDPARQARIRTAMQG